MNESNSIEAIDKTNLTNQTKFRLGEISKIENYFIEEIKHNNEGFKYFIGYLEGGIVKPLCIILPHMSGYIK